MLRDLLVHVDGGRSARGRLRFALDLAARAGATVTGLHVTPPAEVPPLYKPSVVPKVEHEISARLAHDARNAEAIFREEIAEPAPNAPWIEAAGDVVDGIDAQACYADLVILGQYESQGSPERHPLPVAHSVVLRCGRPVLVVPADATAPGFENAAIAWDGSREAVRAVHDALPLLRLMRTVEIITIAASGGGPNAGDIERLSAHLTHHGIVVSADRRVTTPNEHRSLRNELQQGGYDLLVMGGYSHPMWLEFVVGGATQSILLSSKTPILVSH